MPKEKDVLKKKDEVKEKPKKKVKFENLTNDEKIDILSKRIEELEKEKEPSIGDVKIIDDRAVVIIKTLLPDMNGKLVWNVTQRINKRK